MDPIELAELNDRFADIARRAAAAVDAYGRSNPVLAAQARACAALARELLEMHLGYAACLREMRSATVADDEERLSFDRPPFAPTCMPRPGQPVAEAGGDGDTDLSAADQVRAW